MRVRSICNVVVILCTLPCQLTSFNHCSYAQSPTNIGGEQADDSLKTPDSFPHFPALEPEAAAQSFVVQNGFQMQLIASEPMVTDPVAMCIDEDGRAYVAEMNDYPYTDAKTHKAWADNTTDAPLGRVRLLEDTDGDGRYDKSIIFAEGLSWPSGVLCYRGGIFVTATPDIWYLKDTDGDGRADVRDKVFTGFRKYNVQAVMNNPIWGLDNLIYVAGSSNGGSVLAAGQEQNKPITARGDFRIDPRTGRFELQAGGARFGNAFDDWGNRFLCNIRNPAIHVVLDNRYLGRNPFYAAPPVIYNIAEAGDQMPIFRISPVEPWRDLRGRQWSADPTKKVPRSELTGGGVFTSTSGINVYRGDAYPNQHHGQMFVAEVANNVIYRQRVDADGNTFRATRADENVEFVASIDTWFRPVNLYNAPDGTFYVLDMYREFIEHPWSIPDDIHARLDLTSGRDRGRIYRLAPRRFIPPVFVKLSQQSTDALVKLLGHPTSWHRETAQRLLVERGDTTAVSLLATHLESDNPLAAVHALWTLQGLGQCSVTNVMNALSHGSPKVREQAIRVAELCCPDDAQVIERIIALATDADSRVRLQVALTIGNRRDSAAIDCLARLAATDGADGWMQIALCSAPASNALPLLTRLMTSAQPLPGSAEVAHSNPLIEQLAQIGVAAGQVQELRQLLGQIVLVTDADVKTTPEYDAIFNGLAAGARRKAMTLHDLLSSLDAPPEHKQFSVFNREAVQAAGDRDAAIARSSDATEATRLAAMARLSWLSPATAQPLLAELVDPLTPQSLQIAAIRALAVYKDAGLADLLIERLRSMTPSVRDEAVTTLLARPQRALQLLDRIEDGTINPGMLGLARKTQLLSSADAKIKSRAESVLGKVDSGRQQVVARYTVAVRELAGKQDADVTRGRQVFVQQCAACHRSAGVGVDIGPHMETVRTWDEDKLLLNILDPNREVAPQSMSYSIALGSGTVINGMIAEETASSLTVKRANAPVETILRADIERMSNSGQSLMPAGFEETISPEAMADLMAFIRSK